MSKGDYHNHGIYSSTVGIIFLGATVLKIPDGETGAAGISHGAEDHRLESNKLVQKKRDSLLQRINYLLEEVQNDFRRLISEKGQGMNVAYFYEELRLPEIMQVGPRSKNFARIF